MGEIISSQMNPKWADRDHLELNGSGCRPNDTGGEFIQSPEEPPQGFFCLEKPMRRTHRLFLSLAVVLGTAQLSAQAHETPDPYPTLELNASASREVTLDTVTITMSYEHHGNSQTQVAQEVNARIGTALAKAKQVAAVKTRSSGISTWTRYDKNRQPQGWTSRGTLIIESQDIEAAAKLAGELSSTLTFANSNFSLSRQQRTQVERELLQDTAQAFRQRAQETAEALGFPQFGIKHIDLSGEGNIMQSRPAVAMRAAPAMQEEAAPPPPLQLEPGTMTVSISMRGTVYLLETR